MAKRFLELEKGDIFYGRESNKSYDNNLGVEAFHVLEIHKETKKGTDYVPEYDVDWGYTGGNFVNYEYEKGYIVAYYFDKKRDMELSYFIIPIGRGQNWTCRNEVVLPSGEVYNFSTDYKNFTDKFAKSVEYARIDYLRSQDNYEGMKKQLEEFIEHYNTKTKEDEV